MRKKSTKRILRVLLIIVSIASLIFAPWVLVKAWIKPLPNTVQEQVNESITHGLNGIIVYVDEAGKPPAFYSAGMHNRERKIPSNPQTLFKIASISKLYIAVAASKLIKDDRLSLDKTLVNFFPELEGRIENADKITLRMMLQHRSGIPNFTNTPGFWENLPNDNMKTLELIMDMPADFDPDEKYSYSNTNYLLVGEILDNTLGYSHHQYIKKEILIPLKLNNTYSLLSEVNLNDVMSGYYVGHEEDLKPIDYVIPGGSMVATAEDVGIFLRALNDGSLFNNGEKEIYSSIYEYNHSGLLPGYASIARYHKDIDAVVVQFVNTSGRFSFNLSEITYNRILKILSEK